MAEIATQAIDVDLTPGGVTAILHVSQGDYGSRKLIFNLLLNGQPYTIPENVEMVALEGATQKGDRFQVTCTFKGTQVVSSLITNMTSEVGLDMCQLLFTANDGSKLGTANFFIAVEKSPSSVNVAYTNVYWTELAKSWAVGETGLREGEDTNNSKYWAGHAKDVVNNVKPQLDANTDAVAVLHALIDQYVTPSTQKPSEVVAARVGYDGTTYNNLGNAIRAQATKYGYVSGSEEIYFRQG